MRKTALLSLLVAASASAYAQPTITSLYQGDGSSNIALSDDESSIVIAQIDNFGASSNDLISVPVGGGSPSVLASAADINAVVGLTDANISPGLVSIDTLPGGGYIIWDEGFRQGSEQFISVSADGSSIVLELAEADIDGGVAGGFESVAVDANGTIFAHNEFPATGGNAGLFIYPAPYSSSTEIIIDDATITGAIYPAGTDFEPAVGGLVAYNPDANTTIIYWAEENNDGEGIYSATFDANNYAAAPTYAVEVTEAEITAFTGETEIDLRALAVDENGVLYTYTDNSGDAAPNAQLVSIDISGASPVFTTIATEAELLAVTNATGTAGDGISNNGIQIASDGTIYFSQFSGDDDLLSIVPATQTNVQDWTLYN